MSRRNAPLGLRLTSAEPPGQVAEDLDRFALIALEFPAFTDGRAYSTARLLRMDFLKRCGIALHNEKNTREEDEQNLKELDETWGLLNRFLLKSESQ